MSDSNGKNCCGRIGKPAELYPCYISLGHLALEKPNLEQIATEFIFVWLVSTYSLVLQKKNLKKFTWGNMLKFLFL